MTTIDDTYEQILVCGSCGIDYLVMNEVEAFEVIPNALTFLEFAVKEPDQHHINSKTTNMLAVVRGMGFCRGKREKVDEEQEEKSWDV